MRFFPLVVAVGLLGSAAIATAQTDDPVPDEQAALDEEARQLFEAGETAYSNGRYERALEYFTRAYELSGRPVLLFNVGLAAELAREDARALEAYRQFLELVPESPQHTRVRTRIRELEARVGSSESSPESARDDAADPAPDAVDDADTAPAPASSGADGTVGWVVLGASAAVAIAGVVLVGVALGDVAAVENAPMNSAWADVEGAAGRAEPLSIAGFVALGVGIAGAGLGLALGLTAAGSDTQASLRVGPGGLALTGSFR